MMPGRQLLVLLPWMVAGGADSFNLALLGTLREHGWLPQLLTTLPSTNPWRPAFAALAPVRDIGVLPPSERAAHILAAAQRADVALISGSWLAYDLLPALRATCPDLAVVDYNHMEQPEWRDGGYPRASLERAAYLDAHIVSSEHLRGWMLERGADPERVHVCYTNVNTAAWDPAHFDRAALRRELGLAPDELAVLFAGRLEAQKRPTVLAATIAAVCAAEPRTRFLIAGDGSYAGFLRAFVARRGLAARVTLLGSTGHEAVCRLLAAADLFLLPSAHEGIALALFEAMAMAVPPVAAAVGGQAELVIPNCGILLPPDAPPSAYAAAVLALVRNPARRQALGTAARRRVVEQFPAAQLGRRMDELLCGALARHRGQPRPAADPTALRASVAAAVQAAAAHDAAETAYHAARGPRGAARTLYRRLVAAGAWWLVPLADRLRK